MSRCRHACVRAGCAGAEGTFSVGCGTCCEKRKGDSLTGCPPLVSDARGVVRALSPSAPDEEAREAGRQTDYRAEVSGSCGNSSLPWRRVIQMVLRLLMTAATSR